MSAVRYTTVVVFSCFGSLETLEFFSCLSHGFQLIIDDKLISINQNQSPLSLFVHRDLLLLKKKM